MHQWQWQLMLWLALWTPQVLCTLVCMLQAWGFTARVPVGQACSRGVICHKTHALIGRLVAG